jgi:ankyrin repeat protein
MQYSEQEEEKEKALKRRDLSALTNMINDGIDVNTLVVPKNTDVLLAAINKGNRSFFNTVLLKGFVCNNKNSFLYLHHAIRTHDIFFIKKIIEQYTKENMNYNEYSSYKDNCLHIAAGEKNMPAYILSYLTDCGIKWDEKNNDGQTPLHILLRRNDVISEEIVNILKKHLHVFNINDNLEISPLDIIDSYSVSQDWSEMNKPLLDMIKGTV